MSDIDPAAIHRETIGTDWCYDGCSFWVGWECEYVCAAKDPWECPAVQFEANSGPMPGPYD